MFFRGAKGAYTGTRNVSMDRSRLANKNDPRTHQPSHGERSRTICSVT
jgi:hypothetical protein